VDGNDRPAGEFYEFKSSAPQANEPPKRGSRLRRIATFALPGIAALGVLGWGMGGSGDDHDEAHGPPMSVAMIQAVLPDGAFTDDSGNATTVLGSSCAGEGELVAGGYTHFDCRLSYGDGSAEEVTVHVLEGGGLVFRSMRAS